MKSKNILELILPDGTLDWFDIVEGSRDENQIHTILEEKNIPPTLDDKSKNLKVNPKGFTDITITDFRRTLITFRRRYWQVEGQKEYLKRDIKLAFPGTQLEKEFASFLKEDGGRGTLLAGFYRKVSENPGQRI
ncbi:hypothetical protein ISS03_01210 [Patescibacteria group bacterium]|nr:hypothetical protein [Patescibacteria group bacterium]